MSFKNTDIGLIPSEWDFDTIGDSLYIKGRIGWKGLKKSEYIDRSDYRIINGSNVVNNNIDWSGCGYISEERYEESPEIMLKPNDIVMTKDGTIGKLAIIRSLEQKTTVASGLFVIRVEDNSIDVDYLYYYFSSFYFKELVKSRIEGSVIPHLYQKDLVALKLPLPDLSEQKAISKILRTLDDKIEVNNQINKTLENMAQAIFKQWFVDFEFPNEDGEPYKSSGGEMVETELGMIPKGWRVKTILDMDLIVTDYVANGSFKALKENVTLYEEHNYAIFVRNTDLKCNFNSGMKYVDRHSYDFLKKSRLYGGEVIISNVGDVGSVYLCPYFDQPMTLGNNVIMVKAEKNPTWNYFVYRLFNSREGQGMIDSITGGSAQPKFNKTDFRNLKVVIPSEMFINSYMKTLSFIEDCILLNDKQNSELIKIRDSLLPKLMSGKIRVPLDSEGDAS